MWRVTNVIQTSIGSGSCLSALVVFPTAEFLLGPPTLGHIRNLALLRLLDGSVWMLALRGQVWSDERLSAAADLLHRVSRQAFTKGSIESLLRTELDVGSVSLETASIDPIDVRQWDIEKVAFALARQPGAGRSAAQCPARREWAIQADLRDALDEALRCFVDRMDPQDRIAACQR